MTDTEESAHVAELMAKYKELYQGRFRTPFKGVDSTLETMIRSLVHEHGVESTKKALILVFTHADLAWIKNDHLGLVSRPNQWAKHIAPLLVAPASRSRGEQAEFGERPEGKGYRRIW